MKLTVERLAFIEAMDAIAEDFSDGAYFGFMMEENGITVDELEAYSKRNKARIKADAPKGRQRWATRL